MQWEESFGVASGLSKAERCSPRARIDCGDRPFPWGSPAGSGHHWPPPMEACQEFIFARDIVAEETVSPGDWLALQRLRGPAWYHPPGPRIQQACCQQAQPSLDEMRVTNVFLPGSRRGPAGWEESLCCKLPETPVSRAEPVGVLLSSFFLILQQMMGGVIC